MIRSIFLFVFSLLFISCSNSGVRNDKDQLNKDVNDLIKLEMTVIEKSKLLNKNPDSLELKAEIDSLSIELRNKGIELRQIYQEKEMVKEYEETYKKVKKELSK